MSICPKCNKEFVPLTKKGKWSPTFCSRSCANSRPSKYRMNDSEVFIENSSYPRKHLKIRIIKDGMIEYTCAICGIGPEWMGKPMPLILDHINGTNNDNRLSNLRFVCSNCDCQLPTYKSKNKRKVASVGTN